MYSGPNPIILERVRWRAKVLVLSVLVMILATAVILSIEKLKYSAVGCDGIVIKVGCTWIDINNKCLGITKYACKQFAVQE